MEEQDSFAGVIIHKGNVDFDVIEISNEEMEAIREEGRMIIKKEQDMNKDRLQSIRDRSEWRAVSELNRKGWVYGFLIKWDMIICDKKGNAEYCPVCCETITQYTGVKDKNGNKIYEADIVEYNGKKYGIKWDAFNKTMIMVNENDLKDEECLNNTESHLIELKGNFWGIPNVNVTNKIMKILSWEEI